MFWLEQLSKVTEGCVFKNLPQKPPQHMNHMAIWTFFSQVVKVDLLRKRGHKWKNTKVLRPSVFPLDCWDVLCFGGGMFLEVKHIINHHKPAIKTLIFWMMVKPIINHPAMWDEKLAHVPFNVGAFQSSFLPLDSMLCSCADTVVPRVSCDIMMKYDKSMPKGQHPVIRGTRNSKPFTMVVLISTSYEFITHLYILLGARKILQRPYSRE